MIIEVKPGEIGGIVEAPSSKSFTQRYVLYSAFSGKPVTLRNISYCDDELIAIDIAKSCNAHIEYQRRDVKITPDFKCPKKIYVGESGTSYRLSLGLLAGRKCTTEISGKPALAKRPVEDLISCLENTGSIFYKNSEGFYKIDATNSGNVYCTLNASKSSQFASAMLFYYSFFKSACFGIDSMVSEKYMDITVKTLEDFGINIKRENNKFIIDGYLKSKNDIHIEGDYSSASYFMVLGIFTGNILIKNLKKNSLQPDSGIIKILNDAAGCIEIFDDYIKINKAYEIKTVVVDVSATPDFAPVASVIGIFSKNGVIIKNYQRLEIKESNRYLNILDMVEKFGGIAEIKDDFMFIHPGGIKNPDTLIYSDHRMVMSAIIAGIIAGSKTRYGDIEAINKSYPSFLNDLKKLGADIRFNTEI
ncbi:MULTISPECIES: 3-phosphoshikimate 1-carboxyvinyltransferase [unclassified Acidiplasma]|uniref:3-phosphoshikimate 1-carboxyvinyltransferase n=1 Tax=unclassified Acidiplasma TaxID=2641301 RepID=UPI0005DB7DB3|nr:MULTISPECIES: 3-phosphoshikimate 1-carboxyvinyltransferase [unclassified Acidiplasma]KJE48792.1 hypothetical protein TZ01_05725 [Acidiplasma sp. MBA-1]WMT54180.1 MAG: 3-phosphoshikimate 1-carboxyvinyltransferase [Acidiplasma sp.]